MASWALICSVGSTGAYVEPYARPVTDFVFCGKRYGAKGRSGRCSRNRRFSSALKREMLFEQQDLPRGFLHLFPWLLVALSYLTAGCDPAPIEVGTTLLTFVKRTSSVLQDPSLGIMRVNRQCVGVFPEGKATPQLQLLARSSRASQSWQDLETRVTRDHDARGDPRNMAGLCEFSAASRVVLQNEEALRSFAGSSGSMASFGRLIVKSKSRRPCRHEGSRILERGGSSCLKLRGGKG